MAAGISIFFRAPIRPGRSKAWPDSSKCSGEAKMDFKEATPLKGSDGKPLLIGDPSNDDTRTDRICTRPTAVDWDFDGDLDLLVGNFKESLFLFRGEGGGKFTSQSEDFKLAIEGYHSDPFCVDLAGDGDLDILSGSSNGGAQWAENTAEKEITVKGFKSLISEGSREPIWVNQKAGPAGSTRVWADDVNGDGKLDILMGDSTTINTPAKGLSMGKVFLAEKEWEEKMLIMRTEMQNLQAKIPRIRASSGMSITSFTGHAPNFLPLSAQTSSGSILGSEDHISPEEYYRSQFPEKPKSFFHFHDANEPFLIVRRPHPCGACNFFKFGEFHPS